MHTAATVGTESLKQMRIDLAQQLAATAGSKRWPLPCSSSLLKIKG
ncbi:hypothetical protein [Janthinobacterium sp. CG_23.4]|nr:hypothetical protein [Janthinobacterium sp. CG_23.4]MDH6158883.1 hypothetical protein [Janthinobacterium sp. CG_23.4]